VWTAGLTGGQKMKYSIEIHSDRRWSYALSGTRRTLVKKIILRTDGSIPDRDHKIVPRVTLDFPTPEAPAEVWTGGNPRDIPRSGPHLGKPIEWERIQLKLNNALLGRLQEKVRGAIRVDIVDVDTGEVLASESQDLELLAPNEFRQEYEHLDTIAAFVLPTDPFVLEILREARKILLARTGDSSTQGYQSGPERAQQIVHAIYDAMSSMGYDYSNPQGYFEEDCVQRVRTPSQIKEENCATCLDSAVLMASCIAQAGLEPVVFVVYGHAFAGYFTGRLIPDTNVDGDTAVRYHLRRLRDNRLTQLVRPFHLGTIQELLQTRQIQPIETTTTTRGGTSFNDACLYQTNFSVLPDPLRGTDDSTLRSVVIVKLARLDGITPPVVFNSDTTVLADPESVFEISDVEDVQIEEPLDLEDASLSPEERAIPPRIRQWLASLLDLGSRNPLLKIKPSQVMEFDVPGSIIGSLDDVLHKPKGRISLPYFSAMPVTWIHNGVSADEFDEWSSGANSLVFPSYKELNQIQSTAEAALKKIRTDKDHPYYDPDHKVSDAQTLENLREIFLRGNDARLTKAAKKQIDKADEIMLMTGNNSLYLALGIMSWTERSDFRGKAKSTDWQAPLYLYPVILDGGKGRPWSLALDPKSEITPNFCLHEKLRRPPYNLDLQELVLPEEDEHGINLDKMIKAIRQRLTTAKLDNFSVQYRAVLGAFNYANFRLWKDLRDEWKRMAEISPVFKHISYTSNVPFEGNPPIPSPQLDPMLPIAADDSQREAVQLALDGQSFKLEGPPGTGKSQTITNLLASCIAHNKKVLFVAEKQTALNAVKERLDKTRLGTFTLNLHAKGDSDSRLRKNISAALNDALKANIDPRDHEWNEIEFRLKNERNALDRYRASLHQPAADGFSTWAANEQLLEVGYGPEAELPPGFAARFAELWPLVQSAASEVDRALELVPDVGVFPWRFMGLVDGETDFGRLTAALDGLLAAVDRLPLTPAGVTGLPTLTESLVETVGAFVALDREGVLPSQDLLPAVDGSNAPGSEFEARAERILAECRALQTTITPHVRAVNPDFLGRTDHDEVRHLLSRNDPVALKAQLDVVDSEWRAISQRSSALPDPRLQRPIANDVIASVLQSLAAVESTTDRADFDRFVQSLRSLATRVRDHEGNIAPDVIGRVGLGDLEFRAREASQAGLLARRGKVKALRDILGPAAKTADDRLLVNSAVQITEVIREYRDELDRFRGRFPELGVEGIEFWRPGVVDFFSGELTRSRVKRLRNLNLLASPSADDQSFVDALKTLVAVSPLVNEQESKITTLLPGSDPSSFMPWVTGEFERFRTLVNEHRNREVASLIGADALDRDPAKVVAALRVLVDVVGRLDALRQRVRSELFPDYRGEIRPWVQEDIERLGSAVGLVSTAFRELESDSLSLVRQALMRTVDLTTVSAVSDLAVAWTSFKNCLSAGSAEAFLRGRALDEAVRADVPVLRRDSGEHHSYLLFNRWQELQKALATLRELGLSSLVPGLLVREFGPFEMLTRVRRSALAQALRVRMQEGNLDAFDRKIHEQRIAAFEKALSEERSILAHRIPGLAARRRQTQKLPSGTPKGATQELLKGLKPKRGDKTPIRELIEMYGSAMADAMPCFLMSPDSVAALLPVGSIEFDLVVFDEASQIRTAHAMGALGRGKAGIVVGDSRQMPPSNTFSSNPGAYIVDEDDDGIDDSEDPDVDLDVYDEDAEEKLIPVAARDAESILTEFEESRMPERQLLCHYRSKDEVLIAFSNTFIYPEPMLTFPSPAGLQTSSLRFIHVPDGHFERDKKAKPHRFGEGVPPVPARGTNFREAELIVDEVMRRLKDPKRRVRRAADPSRMAETIIVVTFNLPQMYLITEMLKHRDQKLMDVVMVPERPNDDTEFPPQLKIRNLENVQGDEAETVIFSVAFSKTPAGKMPVNFGPVTKPGGERRLNVAVTRAQREMVVYASFLPEDMMLGRKAIGPEAKLVQDFLKLAQKGPGAVGDVGIAVPVSRHIELVADELRELGFEVYTQLGLSSLRVDIALRRPGSESWEFAVMVDDSCWSDRGSAFQREVLPRQVLPAMGWKRVYRIWLPAWKNSRDEILDEFRALLAEDPDADDFVDEDFDDTVYLDEVGEDESPGVDDGSASAAPVVADPDFEVFVPFSGSGTGGQTTMYALGKDPAAAKLVTELAMAVLDAEAPIEATRFGRVVCRAFDFGQAKTPRIEQIIGLLPPALVHVDVVGRFLWREDRQWETWSAYRMADSAVTRNPGEVSYFEYRNALVDFLARVHSLSVEDAVRELAHVVGLQKISAQNRTLFQGVINEAVSTGAVRREGDTLRPAG